MPTYATTATPHSTLLALIPLILTAVTAGYLLACWIYPFTNCRRCNGTGKRRSILGGRSFALCHRCHGNGRQLRIGRHILNHLRERHNKATHTKRNGR